MMHEYRSAWGLLGNVALILKSTNASICFSSPTVKIRYREQQWPPCSPGEAQLEQCQCPEDDRAGGQEKLRAPVALQSHRLNQTQGVLPGPLLCEMIHFLYCSKLIRLHFAVTCSRSTVSNNNGSSHRFLPSQWGKQVLRAEHSRYITLSYNVISAPGVAQSRFRKAAKWANGFIWVTEGIKKKARKKAAKTAASSLKVSWSVEPGSASSDSFCP